jgi:hypothetical protein
VRGSKGTLLALTVRHVLECRAGGGIRKEELRGVNKVRGMR